MTTLRLSGRGALLAQAQPEAGIRRLANPLERAPLGMSRWGRLDRYGRALAAACDCALPEHRPSFAPETGLTVVSRHSCFESNALFHRSMLEKEPRLASPLLFPYTLPGSAASEVAMHFGLGGSYLVFPGGPTTALAAVLASIDRVEQNGERVLLASADVLTPALLEHCGAQQSSQAQPTPPLSEAACALLLAPDGELGTVLHVEGALGPAAATSDELGALFIEALSRAEIAPSRLRAVFSATIMNDALGREIAALETAVGAFATTPLQLVFKLGDCGASLGLLAMLAAVEEPGPALVVASDEGGAVALVVDNPGVL